MNEPATGVDESPGAPPPWWKRYAKWVVGVLALFGVLGAVGGNLVNAIWPNVQEKVVGGEPLNINVREDPQGGGTGFATAARSDAGLKPKLAEARGCDSLFDASKAAGAVDIDRSIHHLLIEGRTHRDVAIVDMRARILKREPPLRGARISCQSAGEIDAIGVMFDLDESAPLARELLPDYRPGEPYFGSGKIIRLTKTEIQPVHVAARTKRSYVEWEIEARLILDGKERVVRINNRGEPFRLTGKRRLGDYARHFEWVWYEKPERLYVGAKPKQ